MVTVTDRPRHLTAANPSSRKSPRGGWRFVAACVLVAEVALAAFLGAQLMTGLDTLADMLLAPLGILALGAMLALVVVGPLALLGRLIRPMRVVRLLVVGVFGALGARRSTKLIAPDPRACRRPTFFHLQTSKLRTHSTTQRCAACT
jgi:hypothetical protein